MLVRDPGSFRSAGSPGRTYGDRTGRKVPDTSLCPQRFVHSL
jgi:hypothetical protein